MLQRDKKVFLVFFFSFNNAIDTLGLKAKGQVLQPNELYTCSNTFSRGVYLTSVWAIECPLVLQVCQALDQFQSIICRYLCY